MIAEIILGVLLLSQQWIHWKQTQAMREEIRLAHNRKQAMSSPELATLQHITKPAPSKSAIAQARKEGRHEPEPSPRAPSLPIGM